MARTQRSAPSLAEAHAQLQSFACLRAVAGLPQPTVQSVGQKVLLEEEVVVVGSVGFE